MRKFFLLLLLYLCQQTYSQEVNVVSVKQLPGTDVGKAYHPSSALQVNTYYLPPIIIPGLKSTT